MYKLFFDVIICTNWNLEDAKEVLYTYFGAADCCIILFFGVEEINTKHK